MTITLANARARVRFVSGTIPGEISDEDIDLAINMAISFARSDHLLVPVADETLTEAEDTYEYNLTGGELGNILYIVNLFEETETSGIFDVVAFPKSLYRVEEAATPYLFFNSNGWIPTANKLMRIQGLKPQTEVEDDEDEISLPQTYLVYKAASIIHQRASGNGASTRSAWHQQQIQVAEANAELDRRGAFEFKVPPNAMVVRGRV